MSKIRFNYYGAFQVFFGWVILTLFLCIFLPTLSIYVLVTGAALIIGLLIWFMNSRKEKPLKSIPIEKRYLYEKIGLGIAALFLDVASLSILIIVFMFIFEKEKDGFTYTAMGIMGFLGLICMYFGILLTRILIVKFKSFEIYQKYLLREEFNGFQENY